MKMINTFRYCFVRESSKTLEHSKFSNNLVAKNIDWNTIQRINVYKYESIFIFTFIAIKIRI